MTKTFQDESIKFRNPNYKLMELKSDELAIELETSSRLELIDWLCWNDRNGVYRDNESLQEFGNTVSKEQAIEIITKQITES